MKRTASLGFRRPGLTDAEYIEELEGQAALLARKLALSKPLPPVHIAAESESLQARDREIADLYQHLAWFERRHDEERAKVLRMRAEVISLEVRLSTAPSSPQQPTPTQRK